MTKKNWTDEELKTRVCSKFHVGTWARRSNGTIVCRECQRVSLEKFRRNSGAVARPRGKNAEQLKLEISKLEEALEIARKKLELMEQLSEIQTKLKQIG